MVATCLLKLQILARPAIGKHKGRLGRRRVKLGIDCPRYFPNRLLATGCVPLPRSQCLLGGPLHKDTLSGFQDLFLCLAHFRPKSSNFPGLLHCTLYCSLSSAITLANSTFIKFYSNRPVWECSLFPAGVLRVPLTHACIWWNSTSEAPREKVVWLSGLCGYCGWLDNIRSTLDN